MDLAYAFGYALPAMAILGPFAKFIADRSGSHK